MATLKTIDGKSFVVSGASRSGKTWYVSELFRGFSRIMAWDPEDQWSQQPGFVRITSLARLAELAQQTTDRAVKFAYVPGPKLQKEFDLFCRILFRWVDSGLPAAGILEELSDVAPIGKADGHYGVLLRRGLKRGLYLANISQRWQEASKTAFGNASEFVIFAVADQQDADYLCKKTGIDAGMIAGLRQFEYLRKCRVTRQVTRGRMPG